MPYITSNVEKAYGWNWQFGSVRSCQASVSDTVDYF